MPHDPKERGNTEGSTVTRTGKEYHTAAEARAVNAWHAAERAMRAAAYNAQRRQTLLLKLPALLLVVAENHGRDVVASLEILADSKRYILINLSSNILQLSSLF